jgi:Ca2+-binding RTX toxin-like protein
MARINSVFAFDMDALVDTFVSSFSLAGGLVSQSPATQSPFPPNAIYSDTYAGQNQSGEGIIFGGSGFAVDGNSSFSGQLGLNQSFTGGTVTGVLGTVLQNGVTLVWGGIEGISVAATTLQTVARTASTADDLSLLRSILSGNDSFDLSIKADLARGYGGKDTMLGDGGADKLYGGSGADSIAGGSGGDSLFGEAGNDTLTAGAGADILVGGGGRDTLAGGTDSLRDVFLFNSRADSATVAGDTPYANVDFIQNFTRGSSATDSTGDDIDLRSLDANLNVGANQAFLWSGSTAKANSVWFQDTAGPGLLLLADVNGDTTADFAIRIGGVNALSNWNVLL